MENLRTIRSRSDVLHLNKIHKTTVAEGKASNTTYHLLCDVQMKSLPSLPASYSCTTWKKTDTICEKCLIP